jgi:two-component system, response regulator PdtaR
MRNILIAEDESIVALALAMGFRELGYTVLKTVNTGRALINEALKNKPEIIISDINLKDNVSGLQAFREIKNNYNCIFIFITGYNDADTHQEIKEVEPHAVILKPTNARQINLILENIPDTL